MDQLILFHKPNKNSEEWEDDRLAHSSNQTLHKFVKKWKGRDLREDVSDTMNNGVYLSLVVWTVRGLHAKVTHGRGRARVLRRSGPARAGFSPVLFISFPFSGILQSY
jgi:hypothetical protein